MNLLIVGDLCLNESQAQVDSVGTFDLWQGIRPLLKDNPLVVANLEFALTSVQEGLPFKWATLKAPPNAISLLSGVDVAILANNHIGDFGQNGVKETIALLEAAKKNFIGYGKNLGQALKPVLLETNDGCVAIVALACPSTNSECLATHDRSGVAPLSSIMLRRSIENARSQADSVLVYLHWGCEQQHDPVPDQMRLARRAIDWGASVVIGCHAHVIQGYEAYRDGWIFYGLGNFYFPTVDTKEVLNDGSLRRGCQEQALPNRQSLAVELTLQKTKEGRRLQPTNIAPLEFSENRGPESVTRGDLTVDLDKLNNRLKRYAALHWRWLQGEAEPEYRAMIRNGVPAYFYAETPISDKDIGVVAALRCRTGDFCVSLKGFIKRLLHIDPQKTGK